ncbi:WD repeat-containing protein 55-like [Corticium candelabrum]|uniref:WD repeat-containing protein 55-like n=1 Tax=Corticium candelabrum TaxID=121492 RepID=UPI002E2644BF|nr:WD repeat-containing protein 55-like [Corticium candelabrum]
MTSDGLEFDCEVFALAFHPKENLIASGLVSGAVHLHSYLTADVREVRHNCYHSKACRAITFSKDGNCLWSGSTDKSIVVTEMESGSKLQHLKKAHSSAIYSILMVDHKLLATGDDSGCVKVWDTRTYETVMEFTENEDFISELVIDKTGKTLLAASGDGTLSVLNMRRSRLEARSDNQEVELLSAALVKNGNKVVCGGGDGVLSIWSWGEWGDISDRLPGHPSSIDACISITDSMVCTGCLDGAIRLVEIHPNRVCKTLGEHQEPVEQLRLSPDGGMIASCSHDATVKFWDIKDLSSSASGMTNGKKRAKKSSQELKRKRIKHKQCANEDFFSDL